MNYFCVKREIKTVVETKKESRRSKRSTPLRNTANKQNLITS